MLVGGDWNMEPAELTMTGWLDKVAGSILQQDTDTEAGTCFASEKAKPSYLDYFVSSRGIMPIIMGAGMDRTAPPPLAHIGWCRPQWPAIPARSWSPKSRRSRKSRPQ